MASGQVPASAGISPIDIANVLGGQKSTTTSGANTVALQQLLTQVLAPQDPTAQLEAIFQQAGGQIPGLTAMRTSAAGARPGSNSGLQAGLDQLQQQTVLKAQQQLAQQEIARQQIAAQAANALAQATKSTRTQSGTNLGKATQTLALLQGVSKLGDSKLGKKAGDMISSGVDSLQNMVLGPDPAASMTNYPVQGIGPAAFNDAGDNALAAFDTSSLGNMFQDVGMPIPDISTLIPDIGIPSGNDPGQIFDDIWAFKDGGLVGRDGQKPQKNPVKGYADGGPVQTRVGGGRSGSAAEYLRPEIDRAIARYIQPAQAVSAAPSDATGTGTAVGGSSGGATAADSGTAATNTNGNIGQAANVGLNVAIGNPVGAITSAVNNPTVTAMVSALAAIANPNPVSVVNAINNAIAAANASDSVGNTAVGVSGTNSSIGESAVSNAIGTSPNANAAIGLGPVDAEGAVAAAIGTAIGDAVGSVGGIGDSADGGGNAGATGGGGGSGGGADGGGDGNAYAEGGEVEGPGTETSDSINAKLSDGEYVIPADVVNKLGVNFFDYLLAKHHIPTQGRNDVPLSGNPGIDTDDDDADDVG